MSRVTLTLSSALLASAVFVVPAKAVEVYLFKGAGDFSFINKNMHFSRGLDRIAEQLNKEGIRAEVRGFAQTGDALRTIRKRRPKSVAFVGHSMGALASMSMARQMRDLGIRVAYVGTLDIPGPVGSAGSNVEWAENYFSITPVYGLLTNVSSHKKAKNIHVFGTHTTMDDSRKVKNGVLAAIRKIHAAEGGTIESEPVETLMVENTPEVAPKPAETAKPVLVAAAPKRLPKIDEDIEPVAVAAAPKRLPKIDEDIEPVVTARAPKRLPKIDEEFEPQNGSNQQYALANAGSVGDINQRITQAHGANGHGANGNGANGNQVTLSSSDLAPINLLAAPSASALSFAPSETVEPEPIEEASLRMAPQEPVPSVVQPSQQRPRAAAIFDRGRITKTGRKLVTRISKLLARNGKRHDRKLRRKTEIDR